MTKIYLKDSASEMHIAVSGCNVNDPEEYVFFRKVGHGQTLLLMLPGNNTSGQVFDGILNGFRATSALKDQYTVLAVDYRGCGKSSYNTSITSLKDFAIDIDKAIGKFADFGTYEAHIVAYSMGFPIAIELMNLAPEKYHSLIGLAPVGTRGVRVEFSQMTGGKEENGRLWNTGDWAPVEDIEDGIRVTGFHQRAWQGENRSIDSAKATWDAIVFNDYLKYDVATAKLGQAEFVGSPYYSNALFDCLNIQYMPESFFFCHCFNGSRVDVISKKNTNGDIVVIPAKNKLRVFENKRVLMLKAKTDFSEWRGDLVIGDQDIMDSAEDLKREGADVTAMLIEANFGYDHGLAITQPQRLVTLMEAFLNHALAPHQAEEILLAPVEWLV